MNSFISNIKKGCLSTSRVADQLEHTIRGYINNSRHLARKYPRILYADIICSEKRTVFRERSSIKTVSFEEQIMSKDKYPCIFLKTNGDYCVYYPSNIFAQSRARDLLICQQIL